MRSISPGLAELLMDPAGVMSRHRADEVRRQGERAQIRALFQPKHDAKE